MFFTRYEILFYPVLGIIISLILAFFALIAFLSAREVDLAYSVPSSNKKPDYGIFFLLLAIVFIGTCFFCGSYIYKTFNNKFVNSFSSRPIDDANFVVSTAEIGKMVAYNANARLICFVGVPENMQAKEPEEIRYLLCIERTEKIVGGYGNGAQAVRLDFELQLLDMKNPESWQMVGETVIEGSSPPSATSSGGKVKGKPPKIEEVYAWVEKNLEEYVEN